MKGFLLDENVPSKLAFCPSFPVADYSAVGPRPTDTMLWSYAKAQQLVIVSKDTDFSNRIMTSSPPPWVVHLRFGNLRYREFQEFLARVWPQVEALLPEHKLISVYLDRVEAIK